MRIITGSTGTTHVTSNNDGEFNQGIFGTDLIVFENGEQLEAAIVDNNTIRVKDGDLIMQGRHALIEPNTTEDVIIETGAVGVNRNDLIVARYVMDTSTGYENITLEVVKGTETAGEALDPEYVTGDIRTGSAIVEVPLYRVRITGINIAGIDKLFTISKSLMGMVAAQNDTLEKHENKITALNGNLANGNVSFSVGDDEHPYITYKVGADTVTKKLGNGLEAELLWENPNPTIAFDSGTVVSLPTLPNYDYVMIELMCASSLQSNAWKPALLPCVKVPSADATKDTYYGNYAIKATLAEENVQSYNRPAFLGYANIKFGNGTYNSTGSTYSYADTYAIPYRIYGVKEIEISYK